jgi:hypothetical protein
MVTTSTAMTAVAAVGVAASTSVTAVAAMADKFHHRRCPIAFLVEDVERGQANVRDFFLMESDLIAISVARSGQVYCRSSRHRRGSARYGQRQTGSTKYR